MIGKLTNRLIVRYITGAKGASFSISCLCDEEDHTVLYIFRDEIKCSGSKYESDVDAVAMA